MKATLSTRRTFLGSSTKAMLAAAIAPQFVPARLFGATAPSNTLNVAVMGVGLRGTDALIPGLVRAGQHIVALCDPDAAMIQRARGSQDPSIQAALAKAKAYEDYRRLLDDLPSIDAVTIATGCRWHVPLSKAFIHAGKHVYCEKPLARMVSEARDLAQSVRKSKVVTQLGTQGANSGAFRRSVEIMQAGLLGPVREVHLWCNIWGPRPPSHGLPEGEDPIPAGFNWDLWLGPAPLRPFKQGLYHPDCLKWYVWYDFGAGMLAEFGQHNFMLPVRALKLEAPIRVAADIPEPQKASYASTARVRYEFAARSDRPPVTLWWYDGGTPVPAEAAALVAQTKGRMPDNGCLFLGEKGALYTDGWGAEGIMKLNGEPKMRGVLNHEAARAVPVTEPRPNGLNHMNEWLEACKGGAPTYCPLDHGADVSEVLLPGLVSLRLGRPIEWDGSALQVKDAPEASRFIHAEYRTKWLV